MNPPGGRKQVRKWFVVITCTCLLFQYTIICTTLFESKDERNYSEPSAYAEPENGFKSSTDVNVPVIFIIWQKIRYFYLSLLHSLFRKRELYNSFNSLTLQQYHKRSFYAISRTDYPYLITAESVCPQSKIAPIAVVVTVSEWNSREQRDGIRKTWGSGNYNCEFTKRPEVRNHMEKNRDKIIDYGGKVRVNFWRNLVRQVFIIGMPKETMQKAMARIALQEESDLYHDIVLADFQDTYRNLSLKVLSALNWAYTFCPRAHYIIKTDHDVFVHLPRLLKTIMQPQYRNIITGQYTDGIGCDVERSGRYGIPYKAYPFEGGYPPHVKGAVYIVPSQIASKLVDAAPYMPYVNIEDVFITGILREVVKAQARPLGDELYHSHVKEYQKELMAYVYGNRLATHPVKSALYMKYMWNVINNNTIC